jgi:hypothetical protein
MGFGQLFKGKVFPKLGYGPKIIPSNPEIRQRQEERMKEELDKFYKERAPQG